MRKADIARALGVPYSYVCTAAKVFKLMEEKNMSLEELVNKKAAKEAPKGSVYADAGQDLDCFGMPAPRVPVESDRPENIVGKLSDVSAGAKAETEVWVDNLFGEDGGIF